MKRGTIQTVDLVRHVVKCGHPDSDNTSANEVTVSTLNIAHGRGLRTHQALVKPEVIKDNLERIAALFWQEKSQIVAIQEADIKSFWTGNINQVRDLAERSGFSISVAGAHMQRYRLSYGTALLSSVALTNPISVTFKPEKPLPPKGAVIATFYLGGANPIPVDIVSVHLDFARSGTRFRQISELIDLLASRNNRCIVMGDFNCDWSSEQSALRIIARKLNLIGFDPHDNTLETFRSRGTRLDWILISRDLQFIEHRVLSDRVSDHQPVTARIGFSPARG